MNMELAVGHGNLNLTLLLVRYSRITQGTRSDSRATAVR